MPRSLLHIVIATCLCSVAQAPLASPFSDLDADQQRAEDILRELVSFESSERRPDQVRLALQAMADRLVAAGFEQQDIELLEPSKDNHGLVVRYRGVGNDRPILLLAHIDVVPAVADRWTFPPFTLGQSDGHYLGRGTSDNKAGVAQIISNFVRLKQEGWLPKRDVIAAISGNEETSGAFADWLANESNGLANAAYAINSDAGSGELDEDGRPRAFWVQTSEKLYQTYRLTARNRGGHSSVPRPDNAIADLATAITRLAGHRFPVALNSGTRMQLRRSAPLYDAGVADDMRALVEDESDLAAADRLAAWDPYFNAMMRTTCVPTLLQGGHAENALPRDASVTVNCRILPGVPAIEVERVIAGLVADLDIGIEVVWQGIASDVSPMPDALLEQIESLVEARWGEIPVIPGMSTGATDGLFFRNTGMPVFGISALFAIPGGSGAHGLDEKISVRAFHEAVVFWYQMLRTLAG
jgi:acetylornithine deacetylase/succinyl-diaminopimelate desuccinylase-like protein